MTTTDFTKTITTRSLVLRDLKRSIVADTAHARAVREAWRRALKDARAAQKAGDLPRAAKLRAEAFQARAETNERVGASSAARRHTLLAYALLRGRRHAQAEPRCAEENSPSARWIARILAERFNAAGDHGRTPTEADVLGWLDDRTEAPASASEAPREAA